MKIKELWKQYEGYIQDLSVNFRRLAYVNIALCWFFKDENQSFPIYIKLALLLALAFFVFDILQYLVTALILRFWIRGEEKKMWKERDDLQGDCNKPKEIPNLEAVRSNRAGGTKLKQACEVLISLLLFPFSFLLNFFKLGYKACFNLEGKRSKFSGHLH